jgi:hypothetical protein
MSINSYLTSLKQKHNNFKKAIRETLITNIHDENTVKDLKKQKLLVKEKITKIEMQQTD